MRFSDFRLRLLGLRPVDQVSLDVAIHFRQLIAIDFEVVVGGGPDRHALTAERHEHDEARGKRQQCCDDPEKHEV